MSDAVMVPNWYKEISSFSGIISTFIIEGNIYDIYPCYNSRTGRYTLKNINDTIKDIFKKAGGDVSYDFMFYNLSTGFFDPDNNKSDDNRRTSAKLREKRSRLDRFKETLISLNENRTEINNQAVKDSEIIRTTLTTLPEVDGPDAAEPLKPTAIVLDFASRFLSSPDNLTENEIAFFLNLQFASNNARQPNNYKNTLILIVDKITDIPAWFYINNPNVRQVTITNPDRDTRGIAIKQEYADYFTGDNASQMESYIDLTDSMKLVEIKGLKNLLERNRETIGDVAELISIYKYGYKDDKWKQIRSKLLKTDIEENLRKRVKGQDEAIKKAVTIIKRAVSGISGMQHSSRTKPKGILFLAGATGTGKTELVKAITQELFEDERSLVRFDMSEYQEENSDQKLFGAPPGYVGYGQGGQLTNAVRANPFSVLLFDEIEKAHPSIMDKFLQILEDGRMTDGQGNTVYFSETLIFFTSNKGTYKDIYDSTGHLIGHESVIEVGDTYDQIHSKVTEALKNFFKPEVYGRIGDNNFVVFNIIDDKVARMISESLLMRISTNILKEQGVSLSITDEAKDWLIKSCQEQKYLNSGGRGIGNAVEELYLNPLGEFLFDNEISEGAAVTASLGENEITFTSD